MPEIEVNGVRLYYELEGSGEPLALVHGSWTDAGGWALVAPSLRESFRVLAYDRRGHSRSERPDAQGSVAEDGDDLGALLEALDLAPAHVVTSSFGGNIALNLALRRPELFRSLSCHEPPLFDLVEDDPEAAEALAQGAGGIESVARRIGEGDHAGAAEQFIDEVAFGPGAWEGLPDQVKETMTGNAPTFLDETRDPTQTATDAAALRRLEIPVRLTVGTASPPMFARVADRLGELIPRASVETIEGADHGPHMTVPERYVEVTASGVRAAVA